MNREEHHAFDLKLLHRFGPGADPRPQRKRPRGRGRPSAADRQAQGHNPLCGDRVTVYLVMDGDRVKEAAFEGSGCAISTASASLMTEAVSGKTLAEVQALFDRFHGLATRGADPGAGEAGLGKLEVFSGVSGFPARVKCATLAWHTLKAAMDGARNVVSTEEPGGAA